MKLNEKAKKHVESCRFCWMCHHICPIGNATGQERSTPRARALGLSMADRNAITTADIIDNIYECSTCGGCVNVCVTGWDPVAFTKQARLEAALDGELPEYILKLVENRLNFGSAYGERKLPDYIKSAIVRHKENTNTLLYLGDDALSRAPTEAQKSILVLEKAGIDFTLLENEPESGAQLDFLIGAAEETRREMKKTAEAFEGFEKVIICDPVDAKTIKQIYREYGINISPEIETFTHFVAGLLDSGAIKQNKSEKRVAYQDPYALSRDLCETEEPRAIISAFAELKDMLLCRKDTIWAGNILMAEYMPEVIKKVAERRIIDAKNARAEAIVTASVSENAALKAAGKIQVLSIEDLILGVK